MKYYELCFIFLFSGIFELFAQKEQWIELDRKSLRDHYYNHGGNTEKLPVVEIMTAISNMESTFTVHTENNSSEEIEDMQNYSFEELQELSVYNSVTNFVLRKDVDLISLDKASNIIGIKSIHKNGITHCPSEGRNHANIGDVFVASKYGKNTRSNGDTSPALHQYMNSMKLDNSVDLHLIRVLVKRSFSPEGDCAVYETEDAHPLELFDYFNMTTNVSKPFNTEYIDHKSHTDGKLESDVTLPSNGIYACDNSWWSPYSSGGSGGYYYAYGTSYACVSVDQTISGSISMNYDFSAQTATKKTLTIGSGVTCYNCYAFLGGQYQLNAQYSYTYGFAFDARVFGGEGFHVDLILQDPSVSATFSTTLISASTSSISLFSLYGITVSTTFKGLDATLTGSGSASGYLKLVAGESITAGIYMNFGYTDVWTYGVDYDTSYEAPSMTAANFQVTKLSVTATLTGKIGLTMFYYSSSLLSGTYEIDVSPYTTFTYGFTSSSLAVIVDSDQTYGDVSYSNAHHFSTEREIKKYSPGENVTFRIEYTDFVPNEKLEVYFSVYNGSISIPVMVTTCISSINGTGNFTASWLVPWDVRFITETRSPDLGLKVWQVQVHCSNLIKKKFLSSQMFQVVDTFSFISAPASGEIVKVDSPYLMSWNPSLLYYFDITNVFIGSGTAIDSKNIVFYLYPESCIASETCANRVMLLKNITNNGQVNVTIASNTTTIEESVYIVIESIENSNVRGWSKNFFRLSAQLNKNQTIISKKNENIGDVDAPVHKEDRLPVSDAALSTSCSSGQIFATVGASYASGLTSMTIATFTISAPGVSPTAYPLISPSDACYVFTTVSPTALPSSKPSNKPLVPTSYPSFFPTKIPLVPTAFPTSEPSKVPLIPSPYPAFEPTIMPLTPTIAPVTGSATNPIVPTNFPTTLPFPNSPTNFPYNIPTIMPVGPTIAPVTGSATNPIVPTNFPTTLPFLNSPTNFPYNIPTIMPVGPTAVPVPEPTTRPIVPTAFPTIEPSKIPTTRPSAPTTVPVTTLTTSTSSGSSTTIIIVIAVVVAVVVVVAIIAISICFCRGNRRTVPIYQANANANA